MTKLFTTLVTFSVLFIASSCYRAPCEDDYCTIPTTNNPCVTRHADNFQPGVSY